MTSNVLIEYFVKGYPYDILGHKFLSSVLKIMNEMQFLIPGEFHYIIYITLEKCLLGENESTLGML